MGQHEQFKAEITQSQMAFHVRLSGVLDENAKMPDIKIAEQITLNLRQITMITSVGTRTWLGWIQRFRAPVRVMFEECPVAMVRHFVMVKGFLPPTVIIQSLFIPFYSEVTGERKDVLCIRGKEFFANGTLKVTAPQDSKGNPMDLDVVIENYLGFLKE